MSLYNYTKNHNPTEYKDTLVLQEDNQKVNAKSLLSNIFNFFKSLSQTSNLARVVVPGIFILIGVGFIYKEFYPDIQGFVEKSTGYLTQGNISPISDEYIDLSKYVSKPTNFPQLTINALQEHVLQDDPVSKNYKGVFYLSIPSLGFNKLPVQANVDGTNEKEYMQVLNSRLAHFKNTGLPISDVNNNIFIYAHSASPNYNPRPTDPYVAFSFLPQIKVGDDIYIEIDNKTYHYKMYKSDTVSPDDTSVITGIKGKRTLTLATCWPLGSDANRFIAIARPVDD